MIFWERSFRIAEDSRFMKKTHKGLTLIEVLVSITVFAIISLALVTSIIGIKGIVNRQEEYVRFEMAAYDMNYYWDKYGEAWADNYFGYTVVNNKAYLEFKNGEVVPTSDAKAPYWVTFSYQDNKLFISIDSAERSYVSNLNCGEVSQ